MLCQLQVYSKAIPLYIYIYMYTYIFFFMFFSVIHYYKIMNIVPCAIQ